MKYSNGYDMDTVLPLLSARVGWRSQNNSSASGRYFEDFHALCQAQNLRNTQINASISDSDFASYLSSLQSAVISRCLNGVLNETEYLEEVQVRDRVINSQDFPLQNGEFFCGYRIKIARDQALSVQIRSVTLYFDSVVTFNLYLFKEGIHQPIKTISVTTVANDQTTIDLTDLVLNYPAYKGDVFYLGFYQMDLGSAHAINEVSTYNQTKVFSAIPFISQALSPTSFNQKFITWTYFPYGMNLQIASFRDFTGLIKKNAFLFDELQGLTMAYVVLEQILYSNRNNADERKLSELVSNGTLQMELQGAVPISDSPQITSLGKRIEREIQRVKKSFYPSAQPVSYTYADCD